MSTERFLFFDHNPKLPNVVEEVKQGLRQNPKRLSPKFFYDERGSQLFDQITQLPEYYLTRTETNILDTNKDELSSYIGKHSCLIEYGSGSSKKVRLLIDALEPRYYVPVDISKEHLRRAAKAIHDDYEKLNVYPTCADYTNGLRLTDAIDGAPRCGFFPGSSIGNFERDDAKSFLSAMRQDIGPGGYCIIGFDSRKAKDILEPAYDDEAGLTAKFNLNLLSHLNQAIDTNFDITNFQHQAFYDEVLGRIEMHLISGSNQVVRVDGETFEFKTNESIHTENSYKYSLDEVHQLANAAGMQFIQHWTDQNAWFYVVLLST